MSKLNIDERFLSHYQQMYQNLVTFKLLNMIVHEALISRCQVNTPFQLYAARQNMNQKSHRHCYC